MGSNVQDMYNEIRDKEKKKKELNQAIKDAYQNYTEFQEILDKMDALKARKKEVEMAVRHEYSSEFNDLEDLKLDIKDMKQVLSDMLWNKLIKNEPIEIRDEYETKYVPNVMVTLKKEG